MPDAPKLSAASGHAPLERPFILFLRQKPRPLMQNPRRLPDVIPIPDNPPFENPGPPARQPAPPRTAPRRTPSSARTEPPQAEPPPHPQVREPPCDAIPFSPLLSLSQCLSRRKPGECQAPAGIPPPFLADGPCGPSYVGGISAISFPVNPRTPSLRHPFQDVKHFAASACAAGPSAKPGNDPPSGCCRRRTAAAGFRCGPTRP